MKKAYQYVKKSSFKNWVEGFLRDCKRAYTPTAVNYIYLGLNTKEFKMDVGKPNLKKLSIEQCGN